MRAKAFCTALSTVVLSLFVFVSGAQAGLGAVYAVDGLFTAINAGELDAASALFAKDVVAGYALTDQSYEGSAEIGIFLDQLHGERREYEIVQLAMVGDTVNLTVDIADGSHIWGQATLTVEVQDGMIQSLKVIETRLMLWRIQS